MTKLSDLLRPTPRDIAAESREQTLNDRRKSGKKRLTQGYARTDVRPGRSGLDDPAYNEIPPDLTEY